LRVGPLGLGIFDLGFTQDPGPAESYNVRVAAPTKSDPHKEHRHATYASETAGLLLVAFLLLVLTVIRYWRNIHWSWR